MRCYKGRIILYVYVQSFVFFFFRYSNDAELRKSLELDANVQEEFSRHRESLQKLTQNNSTSHNTQKSSANKIEKLIKENVILLTELNQLRTEYKEMQKRSFDMESILGISGKYLPTTVARAKLFKACAVSIYIFYYLFFKLVYIYLHDSN